MIRSIKETIKRLKNSERIKDKEGYGGDATTRAVSRHIIELLEEQNNMIYQMACDIKRLRLERKKRSPSDYNLHIAQEMKKGKTFLEAVESWKKKD